MNRSYLRVRLGTSISPYRGSTCYKRRASTFQNIDRGPQADIEKGTKRVYFDNIPECIMALSIKKKKRVLHLSEAGETNRRGEERAGGYEPSLVVVPGPPIPSLPFALPGEIRFFERSDRKRRRLAGDLYS